MIEKELMGGSQSAFPAQTISMRGTWMPRKPVDWARPKGPLHLE